MAARTGTGTFSTQAARPEPSIAPWIAQDAIVASAISLATNGCVPHDPKAASIARRPLAAVVM